MHDGVFSCRSHQAAIHDQKKEPENTAKENKFNWNSLVVLTLRSGFFAVHVLSIASIQSEKQTLGSDGFDNIFVHWIIFSEKWNKKLLACCFPSAFAADQIHENFPIEF